MNKFLSILKKIYYYLRKKKYDMFDFVWTFLWNAIVVFRWQHHWDITKTKKITFDLRARVGDAVVNKPLIILFSKYLKEEMWLNTEILVETNEYNDFIFRDKNLGKYYTLIKFQNEIDAHMTLFRYIKMRVCGIKSNKKTKDKSSVYFSFVPKHISNQNWVSISANLYMDNYLLDFSLNRSFLWYSKNVLSISTDVIINYFRLTNFEKYINDNLDYFYSDWSKLKKSGIMIFVWNKDFRNLTIQKRYDMIIWISKHYKKERIVVIDDNSNKLYDKLINYKFLNNVSLIKNTFSLCEFKDYAKNFELIIWWDWGWFNYIRTVTNSIWIYTVADSNKWHIFSWKNKYEKLRLSKKYFGCRIKIYGKKFWYLYKKSRILPSYDYSVGSDYFDDLPINEFVNFVNFFYN